MSNIENKTKLRTSIFIVTFLVGYIFRVLTFGWLMFVLALPEYLFRSVYYFLGIYIIRNEQSQKYYYKSTILQMLYLLTSFFSFDGGDINTYTFAHLWINPPSYIGYCWFLFAACTIGALIWFSISMFKNRKPEPKKSVTKNDFASGILHALYALVIAPVLAIAFVFLLAPKF